MPTKRYTAEQIIHKLREGAFRKWLKTVTSNAARNALRSICNRRELPMDSRLHSLKEDSKVQDDLLAALNVDSEAALLESVESTIQSQCRSNHWHAYGIWKLQIRSGRPDFERIARAAELTVGAAKMAVMRIRRLIQSEVTVNSWRARSVTRCASSI